MFNGVAPHFSSVFLKYNDQWFAMPLGAGVKLWTVKEAVNYTGKNVQALSISCDDAICKLPHPVEKKVNGDTVILTNENSTNFTDADPAGRLKLIKRWLDKFYEFRSPVTTEPATLNRETLNIVI